MAAAIFRSSSADLIYIRTTVSSRDLNPFYKRTPTDEMGNIQLGQRVRNYIIRAAVEYWHTPCPNKLRFQGTAKHRDWRIESRGLPES